AATPSQLNEGLSRLDQQATDPAFRVWRTGFYLSRAQHSVMAALDRALNGLLLLNWGVTDPSSPDQSLVRDQLCYSYIPTRLMLTKQLYRKYPEWVSSVDELQA